MSRERPRPWHDPTPLVGFEPEWLGQFDTFQDWVSHASRALTGHEGNLGEEVKAICVDAKGRRCNCGGDFMRARDEDAFPVRYFVTGRVVEAAATSELARLRAEGETKDRALQSVKTWIDTDLPAGTSRAGAIHRVVTKALDSTALARAATRENAQ